MVVKLHVISGLPRSGSTLLAALLRQNPRFDAAVSSPVVSLVETLRQRMSATGGLGVFFDDSRREKLLRAVFDAYYDGTSNDSVVFDTNRTWTGQIPLLATLYPRSRIICCVREIGWIIDSIERLLHKNPLQVSRLFESHPRGSAYERAESLMSENGLIGQSWRTLREAWFGDYANRLIVIPYNRLAADPTEVMARLYQELDEVPFAHDFDNAAYDEPAYDGSLGMPGMHRVRNKVTFQQRPLGIPPDLFERYNAANFWLRSEPNPRGVTIL